MMTTNNSIESGFVSVSNLIAEVLYELNDFENRKYYGRVLQKVLNALRTSNVHYLKAYKTVAVDLDANLFSGSYPSDLVKLISVGIYKNGEWWPFTHKHNMANTVTGENGTYDEDFNENEDIPRHGIMFGARSHNIAYWAEDDENCRFFVRNYDGYMDSNGITSRKVMIRYRSNGITCTTENCVPYKIKDFIISDVVYDFARSRIPFRHSAAELEYKRLERARRYDEFTDLEYIPQDMNEFMDMQFSSSNISPKRSM